MCAAQAAGVLLALAVVALWPGGWPIDPIISLGIAAWSAWEGTGPGAAQTVADQTGSRPGESRSRAINVPVSVGMSVPAVMAGAGQGWCVVAPGDS
jgi:hypothetical protein